MSYVKIDVKVDYAKAMQDYNKLLKEMGGKTVELKINPVSGKLTQKTLKEATAGVEGVTQKTEKFVDTNKKVVDSQTKVNTKIKETDGLFGRLYKTLGHNVEKMLEWSVAGTAIFGTLRKISEGVQYVVDMDTALANIRMASGLTRDETQGLAQAYLNLGKELGVAVEEIANSATELYRQGLNTEEVNARLADYIKLSRVLGRDLQSTIELGTAATNSFGVSIQRVGDIATAVGDATASSGDEIMIAIQKSASAAQTAGVSIEELSAMAATVSARTRESGAIVGNSMKSILSKLSQVNDMTGEINEDFGKTLTTMSKVGVQITDDSGNLLNATDILNNLAEVWDTLSQKEQQYVSSSFGVYQVNRFSALLKGMTKNSQEYQKNLEVAYNSFGSTAMKYEEYATTITAATERMGNEWKELYQNTINSGLIISLVNMGASLIDLTDKTNILGIAISMLAAGAMSLLIVKFIAILPTILTAISYLAAFGLEATLLIPKMGALSAAIGTLGVAAIGLAGVTAIVTTGLMAYKAAQEQAYQATLNTASAYQQQNTQASELMQSIEELRGKTELTREEQIKLEGVANNLLKVYPELKNQIDMNALSYDNLANALVGVADKARLATKELLKTEMAKQVGRFNEAASQRAAARERASRNSAIISDIGEAQLGASDEVLKDSSKRITELQKQLDALDKPESSLGRSDFIRRRDGSPPPPTLPDDGKGSEKTEDILKQFESYRDAVEDVNHELTILASKEQIAPDEDKIPILQAQNEKYNELQQRVHEYANALREEQKGYAENSAEYRELQEEIQKQSEAWWANEAAIEANINKIHEMAREAIKKQLLPELEAISKILERTQKDFESSVDKRIDSYEAELDALEKKQKALEQEEERLRIIKDLEEARLKLRNIQNEKNVQLYTGQGATGWEWVADPAQLESAGEAVADLEEKLREFDLDATRQAEQDKLQAKIDALEAQKQAEQQKYNERKQKFDDFENYVKTQMEANDDIKLENLNDFLSNLTEDEIASYGTRIEELRKFVASWNAQVAQMKMLGATGGGSYGSGGSSSGSKTVLVGPDGKAPKGLSAGDRVLTGGGTYRIDKVNSDGSYNSTKVDNQKLVRGAANGGSISSGNTYRINEAGIEGMQWTENGKTFLRPLMDGKIITANNMKKMMSSSNGPSISIDKLILPEVKEPKDFFPALVQSLKTYSISNA